MFDLNNQLQMCTSCFYFSCVVGESARRPIGNLYKLDGKSGTVYSGHERDTRRSREERIESDRVADPHEDHISHRRAKNKGVSGQMERNVEVSFEV